jgi:hypothetical protein
LYGFEDQSANAAKTVDANFDRHVKISFVCELIYLDDERIAINFPAPNASANSSGCNSFSTKPDRFI